MDNEKELKKGEETNEIPSVTPVNGEEQVNETTDKEAVETTTNEQEGAQNEVSTNDTTPVVELETSTAPEPEEVKEVEQAKGLEADAKADDLTKSKAKTDSKENSIVEQNSEATSEPEVNTSTPNNEDTQVEGSKAEETAETPEPKIETSVSNDAEKETSQTVDDDKKSKKEAPKLESEDDLEEKNDEEHHEEEHEEEVDYSTLNKEDLVTAIRELSQDSNFLKAEKKARLIKPFFDEIANKERQEALDKFIADGGEEGDFAFKHDELTDRFEANYRLIRDNKIQYVKDQENRKETNLKKKQEILEKLREFVDSEETNIQFDAFKAIQTEWKEVGPVPGAYVKTLWANYNALVDRFYDNRHIYFELKELDRKKNLEAKYELCEKAEALSKNENVSEAIKELNELHHEFKHIGPVPNNEREALWQRFKGASDAVYDRRKDFVDGLKEQLEANLVIKKELAEKVQSFTSFNSDKIKEWNKKTKELQEVQEKWEATGGLPRANAKEVNRLFWSAFKTFYHNKGQFFKRLDSLREESLIKKKVLVEKAQALKDSTEWNKTAGELKKLQADWRELGPVPEKYRESIYREFKTACDHFFEQKRASMGDVEKEYVENLKEKESICTDIEKMAADKDGNLEAFRELQGKFNAIGFVPKNSISAIKSKYAEAVDKYINSLEGITNEERQKIRVENQINKIKAGPNAGEKMFRKEQTIRKQIGNLENDIALWKNNMEFFAQSKTADKLKEEFETKINAATTELKGLKHQLKIVRNHS